MLVVFGFLALTLIVLMPAQAEAADADGAGTASLENSPVEPVEPAPIAAAAGSDASSSGAPSGGGIGIPGLPSISNVACLSQCVSTSRATRGAVISVRGNNLDRVTRVIFRSNAGRVAAKWQTRNLGSLRVRVPKQAIRGFLSVIDTGGNRARSPRELPILPVSSIPVEMFPIRGPVNFSYSGGRFGAARTGYGHQGQDVSSQCGVRVVAAKKSRVLYNKWDGSAGWYVVARNLGTNTNFVYMHLAQRSRLRVGQVIGAGASIGRIGSTGNATGCLLHFEYWVGPWQTGGRPIDPLPYLRSLLKR